MSTPVLSLRGIAKTFGGARALKGVDLDILPGEVHGLLGHNGSGKSTLVKVLAGYHAPDDGGRLLLQGKDIPLPLAAGTFRTLGLSFVHQNLGLVPSLSVLENLRVGEITKSSRMHITWSAERAQAQDSLKRFGIDIDPAARIADLSVGDRALVAIVRAFEELRASRTVSGHPGILLLDEPTPFLPRESVDRLFRLVRDITQDGASVIFISHDIDEILEITDRVTVLRDGSVAGSLVTREDASESTRNKIIELIVGHALDKATTPPDTTRREACAVITDVSDPRLNPSSFTIGRGEIVGITGLIGSGFERVASLLFGAAPTTGGTLTLDGHTIALPALTPRDAVQNGLAFLPADRAVASGVGALSIADNMLLPDLGRFMRGGWLRRGELSARAAVLATTYDVRPNDPTLKLSALSGGNAQKVLLAKWLNMAPKVLLLDEPTQGVDVGSREQVYAAIRIAADNGTAVLCASSDHEQLADLCHRVLIFARGSIVGELVGADITKERIAQGCYTANASQENAA